MWNCPDEEYYKAICIDKPTDSKCVLLNLTIGFGRKFFRKNTLTLKSSEK